MCEDNDRWWEAASAAFAADTAPVTNGIAEIIAGTANPDYQSYETLLSWETLASTGRGLAGGGVIAVVESLEFVVLWLGGHEEKSYAALAKTYASTIATAAKRLGS